MPCNGSQQLSSQFVTSFPYLSVWPPRTIGSIVGLKSRVHRASRVSAGCNSLQCGCRLTNIMVMDITDAITPRIFRGWKVMGEI
jgi:hypothetical protein